MLVVGSFLSPDPIRDRNQPMDQTRSQPFPLKQTLIGTKRNEARHSLLNLRRVRHAIWLLMPVVEASRTRASRSLRLSGVAPPG